MLIRYKTILKQEKKGYMLVSIKVIWNFELEREIFGMGELVEVLSPRRLREKLVGRLRDMLALYNVPNMPKN